MLGTVFFLTETAARALTWPIQFFFDIKEMNNAEDENHITTEPIEASRRPWESDDEYKNRIKVELEKSFERAFEALRERENQDDRRRKTK